MSEPKYETLQEFWPFYVGEHRKPLTRWLHFVGTSGMIMWWVAVLVRRNPRLIPLTIFTPYFFAWIGHFLVEKNRPATFKYPLKSLLSDFYMYYLIWRGRMDAEVERYTANQVVKG